MTRQHSSRPALLALSADLVLVGAFVLIGRTSHDEDPLAGALTTLWPFAVGTLVGWTAARAWRRPLATGGAGVPVWLSTVLVGLVLRELTGQGVQPGFVVVTAVVLGVFLLGWRAVAVRARRNRPVRPTGSASGTRAGGSAR